MMPGFGPEAYGACVWCRVAVQEVNGGETSAFTIVPHHLADPDSGKVSQGSPLAVALMGHHAGDSVRVESRQGVRIFRVLQVAHPFMRTASPEEGLRTASGPFRSGGRQ